MAAFPNSDLPGHQRLHDRAWAALDRCQETQDVEFKESSPWDDMRFKIIRTAMAMANLRDGGIILIGASERGDSWSLDGISSEHLSTYDADELVAGVNKYASPHVDLSIVRLKYRDDQEFLVIKVEEFEMSPVVCKKTYGNELREGDVFVRPVGQVRTTRLNNAKDIDDVLELAAEKRAKRIIQTAKRIGLEAKDTDEDAYTREQAKMRELRKVAALDAVPRWRIIIRPHSYDSERISTISELWRVIEDVRIKRMGWDYPILLRPEEYQLQGSNWVGSWCDYSNEPQEWKLFQSAQFVHDLGIRGSSGDGKATHEQWAKDHLAHLQNYEWDKVPGYVGITTTVRTTAVAVELAARLCQKRIIEGECTIVLKMENIQGTMLVADPRRMWNIVCVAAENNLSRTWHYPVDDLIADPITPPVEMAAWFFERFGWRDPPQEVLRKDVESFRRGE